jgi:hypothetical protein
MSERDTRNDTDRGRPQTEAERVRTRDEPGRNFEQEVSDINTDPDAGFDFDHTPTDKQETRRSER